MIDSPLDRRTTLKLLGAGALGTLLPAARALSSAGSGDWLPGGTAAGWRHTVRMQGSLVPEDVLWWYTGRIYGQVGDSGPQHLFNLEGTEIYWYRPLDDGSFLMSSRTLTFFRDTQSGAMLRTWENPYTGATVAVDANRLGGRDVARVSADGWQMTSREFNAAGHAEPWKLEWHRAEDLVWFTSDRSSRDMPQPWLESMTVFCDADALADTGRPNLRTHFTSTYLSPWQRWMGMGDRPGHLVWHSSGRKLSSAASVPGEYRQRVDAEYGGVLTAHPDSFD